MLRDKPELRLYLKESDLNPNDKMNVPAALHLIHEQIIQHVPEKGLLFLLSQVKKFYDAFTDVKFTVKQRILKVNLKFNQLYSIIKM